MKKMCLNPVKVDHETDKIISPFVFDAHSYQKEYYKHTELKGKSKTGSPLSNRNKKI